MKMMIVGILDKKANVFISLEPTANLAVATRQLTEVVNTRSESPISKWPEDFSLWHLGNFETETGEVSPLEKKRFTKKLVVEAASVKQVTN